MSLIVPSNNHPYDFAEPKLARALVKFNNVTKIIGILGQDESFRKKVPKSFSQSTTTFKLNLESYLSVESR